MSKGKVLVVDDEASLRVLLEKELTRAGYNVEPVASGEAAITRLSEDFFHVVLLDILMPDMNGIEVLRTIKHDAIPSEVIILSGNATFENVLETMKLGAFDYIRKPYNLNELILQIDRAIEHQRSKADIKILREELAKSGHGGQLIGKSKVINELREMILRIAPTQSTVLILGESGTGKEIVARAIHDNSLRREKPFVAINCASFSEALLESELFGYEKGAFTDAKAQKRGLAEIADGGTLFLDEIGEIPIHFQAKLLRFLERGEIRRVGGTRDIALNVRIICATNQPLEKLVEMNQFRADLYYRLNVLTITVPPLKDRIEDIPLLVNYFIEQYGFQKKFDKSALAMLESYEWKGNIRELKNVVERTCILCPNPVIRGEDLSFLNLKTSTIEEVNNRESRKIKEFSFEPNDEKEEKILSLKEMERQYIIKVLKFTKGHKGKAAKLLQINPKTLYLKMKNYNIVSVYE
ncbi:MAG: sigma-54 dependent transcriptional regulator [Chitinispirillaceae bacterium]|nr:sigma-54 dependent transcriptional regulator [Chitinispirillaceae bacterium]